MPTRGRRGPRCTRTYALLLSCLLCLLTVTRASSSGQSGGPGRFPATTWVEEDSDTDVLVVPPPTGARLPESWSVDDVHNQGMFGSETRYFARRWVSATSSWISPNCPTRRFPLPPTDRGPRPCGCPDMQGRTVTVYGQRENRRLWPWMADWYNAEDPTRPYAANIWNGMGPCPRLPALQSVLHRFPAHRAHEDEDEPWFWVTDPARREMEQQEQLDELLIPLVFPAGGRRVLPDLVRSVYEGAQTLEILRDRWAAWVYSLLVRRARVIYELVANLAFRLVRAAAGTRLEYLRQFEYFGSCPQGAWFDDTELHAPTIRRLVVEGVPVYYRWEAAYDSMQHLSDLAPPDAPMPGSPRFCPPPTPRRTRAGEPGPIAPFAIDHYDTVRIPPSGASNPDGTPVSLDDVDLHMLAGLDPDRSPPANPDETQPAAREAPAAGEDAGTPISLGDDSEDETMSAESDSAGTVVLVQRPSARIPQLLLRMGERVQAGSQPRSPSVEAPWTPDPGPAPRANVVPLANRIQMNVQHGTTREVLVTGARAIPSLFDFFTADTPRGPRGLGIPAARRNYDREPDWSLMLDEDEQSAGAREFLRLVDDGSLRTPAQRLEYAYEHGSAYLTLVEFPEECLRARRRESESPAERVPRGDEAAHYVPRDYRLTAATPPEQRMHVWAQGVRLVLSRPHARAALARGGLLWRIARWAGLTLEHARAGPSSEPRDSGSPRVVTGQNEGHIVAATDDWLSAEEESTLRGELLDQHESFWPDHAVFERNWWQGRWTPAHEQWFTQLLASMFANRQEGATRTRAHWRNILRGADFGENGGQRQGRNSGLD
ncbi:hypothetical protein AURDEDRAFT_175175 [Auricularia subglabra TFB-10046 SS5]|nr:hypothetical protein AURDEDRAFT_175175 [Auricularia subglabra TFB-10046 SS5]